MTAANGPVYESFLGYLYLVVMAPIEILSLPMDYGENINQHFWDWTYGLGLYWASYVTGLIAASINLGMVSLASLVVKK